VSGRGNERIHSRGQPFVANITVGTKSKRTVGEPLRIAGEVPIQGRARKSLVQENPLIGKEAIQKSTSGSTGVKKTDTSLLSG